jgi:hypothetical protein
MSIEAAREATEIFLGAVSFDRRGQGLPHSFMFGRSASNFMGHTGGTQVYYEPDRLIDAALYMRRHGSPHLRRVPMEATSSQLKKFLSDHFELLAREIWLSGRKGPFSALLSPQAKEAFAVALAASDLFVEPRLTTLFPLCVLRASTPFESPTFFFAAPNDLAERLDLDSRNRAFLVPESFPPFRDWDGRREVPSAWLGVVAPTVEAARQTRAAILGAVALLPHRHQRYLFTGRRLFGGYCTPKAGWTISFGEPHTPALSGDVVLGEADQPWLGLLALKLASTTDEHRRQMRSLEYFYRAWVPDAVRRFAPLCGALDAIFGDVGRATAAVAEAVGPTMGADYDTARLRKLLRLRASVIHGGAPNAYESSKYGDYYETYREDAIRDLELIVARCLQAIVFEGTMIERPHTYAALIKERTGIDP